MKVSVDELRSLPGQRLVVDFNELLAGVPTTKPVVGNLTVGHNISGVMIWGNVKTLLKLECDRCLRPYFLSLSIDIDEKFVPSDLVNPAGVQKELLRGDFVEAIPDSGIVDISDVVYQAVTLATPSYCRCGSECPGPPAKAEANNATASGLGGNSSDGEKSGGIGTGLENIDPRWKNLKTLFPKNDSQ